jgi:hypothetical protein
MLVISERELLKIEQYQSRWPLSVRGNIHPHISLCIRSCNGGSSLVSLDHNKILRYTIIPFNRYPWSLEHWLPDHCGPDPIRFWSRLKSGVLLHKIWSGAPVHLSIYISRIESDTSVTFVFAFAESEDLLRSWYLHCH